MSLHQHEKLIEKKYTITYKLQRLLMLIVYWLAIGTLIYQIYANKQIAAWVWVFSAAIIFSLQNFVASFFARLYIKWAWLFEKWDIIKSWNPFMSAIGEVQTIWLFFTTIKEINEHDLYFTDKTVSFPNNLIFNSGIFNFTKNNLLFWHEMKFLLSCKTQDATEAFFNLKEVVDTIYTKSLQDKIYTSSFLYKNKQYKPKYQLAATTQWLEVKIKLMVHFYKTFDTNNYITTAAIQAHKEWKLTLMCDKDFQWL